MGETPGDGFEAAGGALAADEVLFMPHRKRLVLGYAPTEQGGQELIITYGAKEVSFDEARLFPFGEALTRQDSFRAGDAATWGPGYDWDEIRGLLEVLLEHGIVRRGDTADDPRGTGLVPSLLPRAERTEPSGWCATSCEALTLELGGRAVELGHLEAVIFPYRIAHAALDGDGRQVGEANVYPPGLRLDIDTEWRVCQYPGSRFRDDAPMNLSALRAMIKHWRPIMAVVAKLRAEVLRRLPRSAGGWTVADLQLFANVSLTTLVYRLLHGGGTERPAPVHPVLSSMSRVVDGIRMTTHEMLFLREDGFRAPDERVTAAEIFAFAERYGLLLAEAGVCAGPRPMIEEFLALACDGATPSGVSYAEAEVPAEVAAELAQLPAAVDYGFLAFAVWATTRSVWLAMTKAYEDVCAVLREAPRSAPRVALLERLERELAFLHGAIVATADERARHLRVFADTYEQSWRAVRDPAGPPSFSAVAEPVAETAAHREVAARLDQAVAQHLGLGANERARFVAAVLTYVRHEQAVLRAATAIGARIDALLSRQRPARPLTVRDCRLAFTMRRDHLQGFPYLLDTVGSALERTFECTSEAVWVGEAERAA